MSSTGLGTVKDDAAGTTTSSANPPGPPPRPIRTDVAQWITCPAWQAGHDPHDSTGNTAAHMPGCQPSVAAPTPTTSPPNSWPMTTPAGMKDRALRSDPHKPQADTFNKS